VAKPHEVELAKEWIATEIARWRAMSYSELVEHEGEALHVERMDPRGKTWILETEFFWDDRRRKDIRVTVDVWDPDRRISRSVAIDAFIRAADGSFVDE
jgi:hypothetical protein